LWANSYGGLVAIYDLEQRPALFQRIVAASPALSWDNRLLFSAARQKLRELPTPVRLDISVGDKDDFGFDKDTIAFAKLLDELKPAGLDYRFTLYPGENQDSVRLVSFPARLYWVYAPRSPKIKFPSDGLLSPNPVRKGKSCRHSGIGGDERVYQGLSEAVQSRLTSLDSLTIRSLIGH
jgi:pimeloyl-ACP methyl ester carboxylesterase